MSERCDKCGRLKRNERSDLTAEGWCWRASADWGIVECQAIADHMAGVKAKQDATCKQPLQVPWVACGNPYCTRGWLWSKGHCAGKCPDCNGTGTKGGV